MNSKNSEVTVVDILLLLIKYFIENLKKRI